MKFKNLFACLAAMSLLGAVCGDVRAQAAWPAKPITIIVPFPPGGATDVMARLFAPRIEAAIGQPVVVENKSGAGGTIGTQWVARARNDGYTLLWGTVATHGIGPNIYKKLAYDAVADFEPVVHVVDQPYVLVAHPSRNIASVADLLRQAQERPGQIPVATAGVGTAAHMLFEKFQADTGTSMLGVPYKGAGPAMADLLGGQVDLAFDVILTTAPYIAAGRLVPLAVTSADRSQTLPNVPTMAEAGVRGFVASGWNGLFAPRGTPRPIVDKINAAVNLALRSPEINQRLLSEGSIPVGGTAGDFSSFIKAEIRVWGEVARQANVSVD
ncbi:MAG: tripartite tricarboxylate transporter substrate binding protein [Achromobacter sp.]|uniref:Bug family tripartite tricarboxylate transporter substrate binding protein n=1 Tax=Achromobacter sp. TaxID=134375 RepID=UPI002587E32A|nr:tripartite tricarboxylate transporter substrate binding protein [Achromobacter sp.]MCW0209364.1 tripartite tricarboxylate transporter substrate binding protein [Achromobacter sp.]